MIMSTKYKRDVLSESTKKRRREYILKRKKGGRDLRSGRKKNSQRKWRNGIIAATRFDRVTSGLWARRASTAPRSCSSSVLFSFKLCYGTMTHRGRISRFRLSSSHFPFLMKKGLVVVCVVGQPGRKVSHNLKKSVSHIGGNNTKALNPLTAHT